MYKQLEHDNNETSTRIVWNGLQMIKSSLTAGNFFRWAGRLIWVDNYGAEPSCYSIKEKLYTLYFYFFISNSSLLGFKYYFYWKHSLTLFSFK
jgi:hypothetical protein